MSISNHEGESDSELLWWAAKAIGVRWDADSEQWEGPDVRFDWNPLQDDGDAFRLLVALPHPWEIGSTEFSACSIDKAAALRGAIVRAAAELGRRMP